MAKETGPVLNIKFPPRLLARVDACADEAGLSRAEWCRAALAEAATRAERDAARRARAEAARGEGGQ